MVEVNLYFIYWFAVDLHNALNGIHLRPPSIHVLYQGKSALEKFIKSYKPSFLPKSKKKAKEVLLFLDALISKSQTMDIATDDIATLWSLVSTFEDELQEECGHLYVLNLEDQRTLSAYTLVEKIEESLSEKSWKYLSKLARREMEECGKCLAVERYTAAGFHVLRCVEAVIREYIEATGVTLSVSERNWSKYVEKLKEKGATEPVISIIDNMRKDDRNTLMHPEKFLGMDEAIGLFFLSQTALDRLITDMEKRGYAKLYN